MYTKSLRITTAAMLMAVSSAGFDITRVHADEIPELEQQIQPMQQSFERPVRFWDEQAAADCIELPSGVRGTFDTAQPGLLKLSHAEWGADHYYFDVAAERDVDGQGISGTFDLLDGNKTVIHSWTYSARLVFAADTDGTVPPKVRIITDDGVQQQTVMYDRSTNKFRVAAEISAEPVGQPISQTPGTPSTLSPASNAPVALKDAIPALAQFEASSTGGTPDPVALSAAVQVVIYVGGPIGGIVIIVVVVGSGVASSMGPSYNCSTWWDRYWNGCGGTWLVP